jgi:hypothetical protein
MKDKIISLMRLRGPVLPLDISRSLNTNSIMAGAYLSELVSSKAIKISYLKIGGSPLYYLHDHESKLQDYIRVLKPPEKKAYDLLKEIKILKDNELEPITRVSLQNIKDFAKPIEITFNNKKEKYWKWYLLSNDDLQEVLKNKFQKEPKKEELVEKEQEIFQEPKGHQQDIKSENKDDQINPKDIERTPQGQETDVKKQEIKTEENKFIETKTEDQFYNKIINLFNEKKIEILHKEVIKNNSEVEFKILIPTAVGKILYFVVAKSKKRCSDADLSQAYVKTQMNKLPVLFIHSGELTKKANEMLKNEFKIITTYKLD